MVSAIRMASTRDDVLQLPVSVSADELVGLLQGAYRRPHGKRVGLASLGRLFQSDDDRLLATVKVAEALGFAELSGGELELTPVGRAFAAAPSHDRKKIFAEQLQRAVPEVDLIKGKVASHPRRRVLLAEVVDDLNELHPTKDVEKGLLQVIDWCRYAGLFDYDDRTRQISIATA